MYNALCCSIFTPDSDVSGGVPGAKSRIASDAPASKRTLACRSYSPVRFSFQAYSRVLCCTHAYSTMRATNKFQARLLLYNRISGHDREIRPAYSRRWLVQTMTTVTWYVWNWFYVTLMPCKLLPTDLSSHVCLHSCAFDLSVCLQTFVHRYAPTCTGSRPAASEWCHQWWWLCRWSGITWLGGMIVLYNTVAVHSYIEVCNWLQVTLIPVFRIVKQLKYW